MILAPSILSADFSDLRSVAAQCKAGGAQYIHVDVMDNHFVPNLTVGPVVVKALRPVTDLVLDVHLMVTDPASLVVPFAEAGADILTFHLEATTHASQLIEMIHAQGLRAGISIKPETSLEHLWPILSLADLVLVMSVEPGFGGQAFIPTALDRIQTIAHRRRELAGDREIQLSVDGGIKLGNARKVLTAGADVLVSGSGIFDTDDPVTIMRSFLELGG